VDEKANDFNFLRGFMPAEAMAHKLKIGFYSVAD
jgi:hypothetical protein